MAFPDETTLRSLVELACRAPSVHNTQPWRWAAHGTTLDLFADPRHHLLYADTDRRNLVISCGAALHQLVVAAAASGWGTQVRRLPDPLNEDHLASITFHQRPATPDDLRTAEAAHQRHTDRRMTSSWAVPAARLDQLGEVALEMGVVGSTRLDGAQLRVIGTALAHAFRLQNRSDPYLDELLAWTHTREAAGIPTTSLLTREAAAKGPGAQSRFPTGSLGDSYDEDAPPEPAWMVLSTSSDDTLSWLRAGEALLAVWLVCTSSGLSAVPYTQPIEVPETRETLQREVLSDTSCPQLLLRVGWPVPDRQPVPRTPRRPVEQSFTVFE